MKLFIQIISLIVIAAILLPITAFAAPSDATNISQDAREESIMELLNDRQIKLMEEHVDLMQLNAIDLELYNLGVDFLTQAEVNVNFPDAAASMNTVAIEAATDEKDSVMSTCSTTSTASNSIHWMTYTTTNYLYEGEYYDIEKLVAQPLDEDNPLWDEGQACINYSVDWEAGTTTFIKSVASIGISALAPKISTVYDVLSSTWDSLKKVSVIDASDVTYRWENSTEAVFSYVNLTSDPNTKALTLIATKCFTSVAYIVDIDAWYQNGDGIATPVPAQQTGTKWFYSTSHEYGFVSRACYAFNHYVGGPLQDSISKIVISGPESKTSFTIYPCCPSFPSALVR